jgi:hypothetical protein
VAQPLPPSLPEHLQPDCARCCGLCCVAPPFDASQGFGFDKAAHAPCLHLQDDFRCRIHHALAEQGFPACASFDCYGAGQRVTQHLFHGADWRTAPELATRMFTEYARLRSLHELQAIVTVAIHHAPSPQAVTQLQSTLLTLEMHGDGSSHIDALQLRNRTLQSVRLALTNATSTAG